MEEIKSKAVDSKVIERLRKLLALANDARGNENETALAMERAQAIMTEYNLTMAQIGASNPSADDEKREKGFTASAMYEYQRNLMKCIAEINFCFHWNDKHQIMVGQRRIMKNVHVLLGRESNVLASKMMFEYLNDAMERLVPIESNRERNSKFAISWKEGCAARLIERLKERKLKMEEESRKKAQEEKARQSHPAYAGSSGTALVVVLEDVYQRERDLDQDYRYGWEPGTTARRRKESEAQWLAGQAERNAKLAREAEERRIALANETPAQKRKRERDEEAARRRSDRYWDSYYRKQQRKMERKDITAYHMGREKAEDIGLDPQVGRGADVKKITG